MDKYHCKFTIINLEETSDGLLTGYNWEMRDHKGKCVAAGPSFYKNWHNAKRALDRHIKVLQSANFTLPSKPLRKEYTFKKPSHVQQS